MAHRLETVKETASNVACFLFFVFIFGMFAFDLFAALVRV